MCRAVAPPPSAAAARWPRSLVIGGRALAPAAPARPRPRMATVRVARTNLLTTVLTPEGTLGYASTSPVVNQLTGNNVHPDPVAPDGASRPGEPPVPGR